MPWDSQLVHANPTDEAAENELKSLKRIRQPLPSSFGKSQERARILPAMGWQ